MRKRKDKNITRDIIFAVGVVIVVAIVGVGVTNASKAQEILGKTIRIIVGDTEIIIEGEESIFGGLVHNIQEDFSEGISVDGTEVITGAGIWSGKIIGTTSGLSAPIFGSSSFGGCLVLGDSDGEGLYYTTVLSGTLTTTGGVSGAYAVPAYCGSE